MSSYERVSEIADVIEHDNYTNSHIISDNSCMLNIDQHINYACLKNRRGPDEQSRQYL